MSLSPVRAEDGPYTVPTASPPGSTYTSGLGLRADIPREGRIQWYRDNGHSAAAGTIGLAVKVADPPASAAMYIICHGAPIDVRVGTTADGCGACVQVHYIAVTKRVFVELQFAGELPVVLLDSGVAESRSKLLTVTFKESVDCNFDLFAKTDKTALTRLAHTHVNGAVWLLMIGTTHVSPLVYEYNDGWRCQSCGDAFDTTAGLCAHMHVAPGDMRVRPLDDVVNNVLSSAVPPIGVVPRKTTFGYNLSPDHLRQAMRKLVPNAAPRNTPAPRHRPAVLQRDPVW